MVCCQPSPSKHNKQGCPKTQTRDEQQACLSSCQVQLHRLSGLDKSILVSWLRNGFIAPAVCD